MLDDTEGEEQRIAGNMGVERKSQKGTRAQREPRKKETSSTLFIWEGTVVECGCCERGEKIAEI